MSSPLANPGDPRKTGCLLGAFQAQRSSGAQGLPASWGGCQTAAREGRASPLGGATPLPVPSTPASVSVRPPRLPVSSTAGIPASYDPAPAPQPPPPTIAHSSRRLLPQQQFPSRAWQAAFKRSPHPAPRVRDSCCCSLQASVPLCGTSPPPCSVLEVQRKRITWGGVRVAHILQAGLICVSHRPGHRE